MDLKRLVSNVEACEELVTLSITIPKSQKENMEKLAEHFMPDNKRGKLSALIRLIFKEVIEQNKSKL